MATKKTAAPKTAAKKAAAPAKKAAPVAKKAAAAVPVTKPLKDTFNKSSLVAHLVAQTELDKKTVQTVLSHLENTIVSSIHKKGAGEKKKPDGVGSHDDRLGMSRFRNGGAAGQGRTSHQRRPHWKSQAAIVFRGCYDPNLKR